MSDRDNYPNLPKDVSILHCTSESPMPIENKNKLVELKQLWIHDGAEEIYESDSGRFVTYKCPSCTAEFTLDLGD